MIQPLRALRENFLQLARLLTRCLRWLSGGNQLLRWPAEVVRNFVGAELGEHYTVSPDFDLVGCFKDRSQGADHGHPTNDIYHDDMMCL